MAHQSINVALDAIASRDALSPSDWADVTALLEAAVAKLDAELGYRPRDSGFVDILVKEP